MACSEAVKGVVVVEVEGVVRAVVRVVVEKVEVNSVALMGVAAMVAELAVAVVATVGHMEADKLAADAVAVPVVAVAVVATEEQAADAPAREAAVGDLVEAMMEVTTEAITEAATEAATEGSPLPSGWPLRRPKPNSARGARALALGSAAADAAAVQLGTVGRAHGGSYRAMDFMQTQARRSQDFGPSWSASRPLR